MKIGRFAIVLLVLFILTGVEEPGCLEQEEAKKLAEEEAKKKAEEAAKKQEALAKKESPFKFIPRNEIEKTTDWDNTSKALPKDKFGNVDWMAALKSGTINPREALDPKEPPAEPFDYDILFEDTANMPHVLYPHSSHTMWLVCDACHPSIFEMQKGANPVSMAEIGDGKWCGRCHGKVAFSLSHCDRCHSQQPQGWAFKKVPFKAKSPLMVPRNELEKTNNWEAVEKALTKDAVNRTDWAKALRDKKIDPRESLDPNEPPAEPFDYDILFEETSNMPNVLYPHSTHTTWLVCDSCHPSIFEMAKGANPVNMTEVSEGKWCGECHGKVAFSLSHCDRCHSQQPQGWAFKKVPFKATNPLMAPRNELEKTNNWETVEKALPKDDAENVDWVKALNGKKINPRESLDPKEPPAEPFDYDIVFEDTPGMPNVVYPHLAHTQWLVCDSCHPSIFEMAKGANPVNMTEIFEGKWCGECHGKVAFPLENCFRCHSKPVEEGAG